MPYPYHFVGLDEEQEQRRRRLLNNYGQFAQLSILLLPLVYQLGLGVRLLIGRLRTSKGYQPVKEHQSPVASRFKSPSSNFTLRSTTWTKLRWLLDEEPRPGWGTRQQWLFAAIWTLWLLLLASKDTGDDYLHLTRRFGIVAASQLPLHYLLAAKAWSPVQYLARMSHEELNPYHRLLGRIIIILMATHASMYLNFYVQKGLLLKRIRDWDVILGLTAISTAITIGTTALARIRDWNYRVFFYLHVILSITLLPVLYLHVSFLRVYILEAAAVYVLLIAQRNFDQAAVDAIIENIPNTNLISITIPLTKALAKRTYKPGQHIYIGFPSLPQKLRINPFSIANPNPSDDKQIHVVARTLDGTTAMLASLSSHPQPSPLLIEGPYGSAKYFPDLGSYDSVLLVAGGVGATFTLPFYRDLLHRSWKGEDVPFARFVWTVKKEADARWGVEQVRRQVEDDLPKDFEVYVTRDNAGSEHSSNFSKHESVELQERDSMFGEIGEVAADHVRKGRPDLHGIVDEIFSHDGGDKVAVLVCGPTGMGAAVRKEVGQWVWKGRDVFWHSEEFGW
ncbi:hypothetical protein P7C71_g4570, partial [Lecanoromycetidae sp. Uapishka_2]